MPHRVHVLENIACDLLCLFCLEIIDPDIIGQYAEGIKDNYAFCWECHDSDLLELAKTTTATNFRDGERNLHYVHLIGKKGRSCSICHDVHATKREHLIVDKVPFGDWEFPVNYVPDENGGSCFPGCHQQYKYTR